MCVWWSGCVGEEEGKGEVVRPVFAAASVFCKPSELFCVQLPWPGCLHTTECPDSTADASQYLVLTESLAHLELGPTLRAVIIDDSNVSLLNVDDVLCLVPGC